MTAPAAFPPLIKHYRLTRELGRGGMGIVVEGFDRRDDSRVAVKLLYPHLALADETYRERFEREAHIGALLRSPYTVHLLDYGVEQQHYFIVMEFIEGTSLAEVIRTEGPLEPVRALRIASEIARALEEAGARGVVHRDIKPENVLIDRDGRVKVTDFGIARQETAAGLTGTGGFVGTAHYAAPEQTEGLADQRTDIYALGATLYCMLAGHPPYDGRSVTDILIQHRIASLPMAPLSHLPDPVQNLVRRCLEKDPLDRYQSASELVGALERARAALTRQPGLPPRTPASDRVSYAQRVLDAGQPPAGPTVAAESAAPASQAPPETVRTPPPPPPAPAGPTVVAPAPRAASGVPPVPSPSPAEATVVAPAPATVSVTAGSPTVVVPPPGQPPAASHPPATAAPAPAAPVAASAPGAPPPVPPKKRPGWHYAILGAAALGIAAVVALMVVPFGDDGPAASGDPSPTPGQTVTVAAATSPGSTPTPAATATATPTPERLPTVYAPVSTVPLAQLFSGARAEVVGAPGTCTVEAWLQPTRATTGQYAGNRVVERLCTGDTVVVATNSPAASTFRLGEGLMWWRVLIEKTGTVAWVAEAKADGQGRQLSIVRRFDAPPPMVIDPKLYGYTAIIETELGQVELKLYAEDAPVSVNNFVFLAERGFYNGLSFFRATADLLQGGDPLLGQGGGGDAGYQFRPDVNTLRNTRGTVSWAQRSDGLAGSQFFINAADNRFLDADNPDRAGAFYPFAGVIRGIEIIDEIVFKAPRNGELLTPPFTIYRVTIERTPK